MILSLSSLVHADPPDANNVQNKTKKIEIYCTWLVTLLKHVLLLIPAFLKIPLVHLFLNVFIQFINLALQLLPPLLWRQVTEVLWSRTLAS